MSASPLPAPDAHHRLNLLLESTGEGIFGIDLAGCCTFVNRAAALMLGWRTEEVGGRNMHALIHHAHPDGSHYPESECPISTWSTFLCRAAPARRTAARPRSRLR